MPTRLRRLLYANLFLASFVFCLPAFTSPAAADEANQKALAEALSKFTLPEMPAELKQKFRDYVPNDLKRMRDAANAKSTADWKAIDNKEEWETFRKEKLKLLRESLGVSFQKDDWKPPQLTERPVNAGVIKGEGYRIEKLIYRSAYGQWITANLYAPEPAREKMPGFIISHAHHTPKEHGELQDMGVLWARAGCYVLVPDHLGHGERRQHPFKSKADYEKDFQVSRQDYYFRYDVNLQLNIVGESLMGCLALDLMSGVSLLLDLPGIDKDKIIMLGAVAGGGDPCAVAAALDERVACAAPFNFGGPQPETKYPLPEDAETSFNYGGGGGWESTRNLAFSYRDGFLPWVIVGSIAPRRLIYGHEFSWDRERDPVWKRFEKIYGWYDKTDHLSYATGYGSIQVNDPPGSHCTHIGKTHRKKIHEALAKWFDIKLPGGEESTDRHDAAELRCWTEELRKELKPQPLHETMQARFRETGGFRGVSRQPVTNVEWESEASKIASSQVRQVVLSVATERKVPVLVFQSPSAPANGKSGVLVITRASKQEFVRQRADMIAQLLDAGVSVALPDLYSTGLTGGGSDLGRRSGATGRASTLAMFGLRLNDLQGADANTTLQWLKQNQLWDLARTAVWSDSLIPPNAASTAYQVPRDDDGRLPRGPDPLPQIIALHLSASEKSLAALYIRGGLQSYASALKHQLVLLPQDSIPLSSDTRLSLAPLISNASLRQDQVVDCLNREVPLADTAGKPGDPSTAVKWLLDQLKVEKK